jgi:aryl-alcohol dehydrogenase-like predicted oxidoreductase
MEYRRLGRTGVQVSRVCLGTVYFGSGVPEAEATRIVHRAIDLGINFVDTAEIYQRPAFGAAEEALGRALRGRRHEVVLATKVRYDPGAFRTGTPADRSLTRRDVMRGVEISLRRLQTDHVDLYYPHHVDPATPIEETLRAFDDLVHQGKVRYVGLSNFGAWQTVEALWAADRRGLAGPVCVQTLYNLLDRSIEAELLPACARFGLSLVPYSPLAGGVLTGKYRAGAEVPPGSRAAYLGGLRDGGRPGHVPVASPRNVAIADRLGAWARDRGLTPAHVALAWCLRRPEVASAIMGASTVAQLEENAPAFDLTLAPEQVAELEALIG